jgi:hypothetical protein
VRGKQAIPGVVADFFTIIKKAIRHDLIETWTLPEAVIYQGTVTYICHSGSQLRVPFANIFRMQNGLILNYLIYVDNSQLYTQPSYSLSSRLGALSEETLFLHGVLIHGWG